MMVMPDEPPKSKGRHRVKVENDMIRKREREFKHEQMWTSTEHYFKHFDKVNNKFDSWTSPRYYEDNNKLLSEMRSKRAKEELLQKRREKLRKLLEEEQSSYEIEVMVKKNLSLTHKQPKVKPDDIPTDILKDVNIELKQREEEKRRKEAELKLYHQWRINNPIVRQYESKYRFKDLKLSWLDQQIEKKMQKENEERETKKMLKEQEERLKRETKKEEQISKEIEQKKIILKEDLEKQIQELRERQKISDELRLKEREEMKRKIELEELEERQKQEQKRRLDRECALYNIKQYKLKLKQKVHDIQENLANEKELIIKLKEMDLQQSIEDQIKRNKIKLDINKFLDLVKEQQELEKRRQKHMEFIFDSEAKAIYEKQSEAWQKEEMCRKKLLKDVLETVKKQLDYNLERNKDKQKEILKEREEIMAKVEEYNQEMATLKEEEQIRKHKLKKILDEDIKLKNIKKKEEENSRLKEIDDELERVRREEERLQKEILDIQRRQGPYRPTGRTRLFY